MPQSQNGAGSIVLNHQHRRKPYRNLPHGSKLEQLHHYHHNQIKHGGPPSQFTQSQLASNSKATTAGNQTQNSQGGQQQAVFVGTASNNAGNPNRSSFIFERGYRLGTVGVPSGQSTSSQQQEYYFQQQANSSQQSSSGQQQAQQT